MRISCLPAVVFWVSIVMAPNAHAQGHLTIGYNQDLAPSFYRTEKEGHKGIDAEIIQELFRRSGLTYKIWFVPWKRLMHMPATGTPIIICTGFSERLDEAKANRIGIKGFLMKPVLKSDLANLLRKTLDEAEGSSRGAVIPATKRGRRNV
ncbi:MAG: hypothetical protein GY846_11555 [Deltaproteobacteria bacterium]|nr:hypothetical protein [Deltaproteobacteria bacterium]